MLGTQFTSECSVSNSVMRNTLLHQPPHALLVHALQQSTVIAHYAKPIADLSLERVVSNNSEMPTAVVFNLNGLEKRVVPVQVDLFLPYEMPSGGFILQKP